MERGNLAESDFGDSSERPALKEYIGSWNQSPNSFMEWYPDGKIAEIPRTKNV